MIMSDKNPKHPLKKKKVAAKVNMADHEAVEEAREAHKSKEHVYVSDTPADDRRKGTGSCTARSAVRPLSLFASKDYPFANPTAWS